MSGEFGNQLLVWLIAEVFRSTTPYLWLYPLVAFAYANGFSSKSISNHLSGVLSSAGDLNRNFRHYRVHVLIFTNVICALATLAILCTLVILNGLLIGLFGLLLSALELVQEVKGIPRVAIVTGVLVFVGLLANADKPDDRTQSL
jgi:hypothetical protein